MMQRIGHLLAIAVLWVAVNGACHAEMVHVTLDTHAVADHPDLVKWGEDSAKLSAAWYPRLCNLLPTVGWDDPTTITIVMQLTDEGIAGTSGDRIEISSGWITRHPEDTGLVVHELTHIVQSYPSGQPGWVVEGIADYIRWAIYEAKPLDWFPATDAPRGYEQSYQVTAGFFFWLESDRVPGIVKKLNTALRHGRYDESMFKQAGGDSLDALWSRYVEARKTRHD